MRRCIAYQWGGGLSLSLNTQSLPFSWRVFDTLTYITIHVISRKHFLNIFSMFHTVSGIC